MPKRVFIFLTMIAAGLCNGCGGGQTKPDDPNSQHQQHRCGPDTRCGGIEDDDSPPKNTSKVIMDD